MLDLTGQRYGRLVVLSFVYRKKRTNKSKSWSYYWKCRCDCGTVKVIAVCDFKYGDTRSCGCYRLEKARLAAGESSFNSLYKNYKSNAKKRKIIFLLPREDFRNITKQNCYYCGAEPAQISKRKKCSYGAYIYNGIDRIDNTKGYELDNCVPCCGVCNCMKWTLSFSEFLSHITKIQNKHLKNL